MEFKTEIIKNYSPEVTERVEELSKKGWGVHYVYELINNKLIVTFIKEKSPVYTGPK